MVRLDGIYIVTTSAYCAWFDVEAGHIQTCAPILRRLSHPAAWAKLTAKAIAIVGCRPPKERTPETNAIVRAIGEDVRRFVASLPPRSVVVSGAAAGVDRFAGRLVWEAGHTLIECPPDYQRYDPRHAPLMRNSVIVATAGGAVHGWPGPWSRGTWDTLRKAGDRAVVHEPWQDAGRRTG